MQRIEEITLLYQISKALNEHLDLRKSLYKVLELLSSSLNMMRGTITILDPVRNEINIEVAHGLPASTMRSVKYKLGEGITGRVIETGEAVAIPRISQEPLFLNRTAARRKPGDRDHSFICVPVKKGAQVIGALSVDRPLAELATLQQGKQLLSVIATMIARHVVNLETIRIEKERLREENRRLRGELENRYNINNIIGNSNKMREVYQMISQVCRSNATVLVRGESGTGKELVAKSIHFNSPRRNKPFVAVNCSALAENLLESELFGHERGAFTGAVSMKKGRFELAEGGTLFLDEIGELSPNLQVKLLRVIQERTIERVGGIKPIPVDIRIIVATNRSLKKETEAGRFREDLYYRLNVLHLVLPPLRKRTEDIPPLVEHFIAKYSPERKDQVPVTGVEQDVYRLFYEYSWPGNVRELENVIERALVLCPGSTIRVSDLPRQFRQHSDQTLPLEGIAPDAKLAETLAQVEKMMIERALKMSDNVQSHAAKLLGIGKSGLSQKIKKFKLDVGPKR